MRSEISGHDLPECTGSISEPVQGDGHNQVSKEPSRADADHSKHEIEIEEGGSFDPDKGNEETGKETNHRVVGSNGKSVDKCHAVEPGFLVKDSVFQKAADAVGE